MSSCSTPWWAEYVSWQTAARTPRILLAATEAPTPRPQMRMPRSAVATPGSPGRALRRSRGSRRVGSEPSPPRSISSWPRSGRRRAVASSSSLSAAPAWSAANATRIVGSAQPCASVGVAAVAEGRTAKPQAGRLVARIEGRDPAAETVAHDPAADVGDVLGGEAEVLEDRRGRGARAEVVDPDDRALVADPALPAERDAGLDAQPLADGRRQDRRSR